MGRIFLNHLGGTRLFSCASCDTPLTNRSELISTRFTGATGRAFLFNHVVNLNYSEVQDRVMLTGRHMVRDVACKNCEAKLGWVYEFATEENQRYKEGRVILERALVTESEGFEEHVGNDNWCKLCKNSYEREQQLACLSQQNNKQWPHDISPAWELWAKNSCFSQQDTVISVSWSAQTENLVGYDKGWWTWRPCATLTGSCLWIVPVSHFSFSFLWLYIEFVTFIIVFCSLEIVLALQNSEAHGHVDFILALVFLNFAGKLPSWATVCLLALGRCIYFRIFFFFFFCKILLLHFCKLHKTSAWLSYEYTHNFLFMKMLVSVFWLVGFSSRLPDFMKTPLLFKICPINLVCVFVWDLKWLDLPISEMSELFRTEFAGVFAPAAKITKSARCSTYFHLSQGKGTSSTMLLLRCLWKKARSSIRADRGSGLSRPLVYPPPPLMCHPPPRAMHGDDSKVPQGQI